MQYKLLVLDLDGTLTNEKKEITPHTKEVLMEAQRLGIRIILASGRPTYGIAPLAEELRLAENGGIILAFNGGRITDWATKEVLFEQYLDPSYVPQLHARAAELGFAILTYKGDSIITTRPDDEFVGIEARINRMPVIGTDDFLNDIEYPINKCLMVGAPEPLSKVEPQMKAEFPQLEICRSLPYFMELVPPGIDKANSLSKLLPILGIKCEEMVAMGDGYNDLSMIEYAGLGVAMSNAVDAVKEKADVVTLSNEEDGVAYAVEKYMLA